MNKQSTLLISMTTNQATTREVPESESNNQPKKRTVDFLRQFARCYCYESAIGMIGGIVLN